MDRWHRLGDAKMVPVIEKEVGQALYIYGTSVVR